MQLLFGTGNTSETRPVPNASQVAQVTVSVLTDGL